MSLKKILIEINESVLETHTCSSKAACINLKGSFKCVCSSGFSTDIDTSVCSDTDECALDTHNCGWNTICQNTIGSFKCVCPPGYRTAAAASKGDENVCIEIDECQYQNHKCSATNSHCQNTMGSYECVFHEGFTMYNDTCMDINECHNSLVNKCDS